MSKHKNKNHYGTFLTGQSSWQKYKKKAILALLVLVFLTGSGFAIVKHFEDKSKSISVADTKSLDSVIPAWWTRQYFSTDICDKDNCKPEADPDNDKLTNAQEFYFHTNPVNAHTVKDKLTDGELVAQGFDPSKAGHVTFDQAIAADPTTTDGLVFDSDVVKILSDITTLNNVQVPPIDNSDLNITTNNSTASITAYLAAVNDTSGKYFDQSILDTMTSVIQSGDPEQTTQIQEQSVAFSEALKALPTPSDAAQLAKDWISMFKMLPTVVNVPSQDKIEDINSPEGTAWYAQTRTYMYLMQQSQTDLTKLAIKYQLQ